MESLWKNMMWGITQFDLLFNKITLATLEYRLLESRGGRSYITNPGEKIVIGVVVMRSGYILDTF